MSIDWLTLGLAWITVRGEQVLVNVHGGSFTPGGFLCVDLITGAKIRVHPEQVEWRRARSTDVKDVGLVPPKENELQKSDPWWDMRARDPLFRAVVKVLIKFKDVVYYSCDWRPWLWGEATCPLEEEALEHGEPARRDSTHSKTYGDGGGGYLERFASECELIADDGASTAVMRVLSTHYEYETRGKGTPKLTFDELLADMGWDDEVFDEIDRVYNTQRTKLRRELIALGLVPEFGQLDLFEIVGEASESVQAAGDVLAAA